jgi:uncharacterized membrane protein
MIYQYYQSSNVAMILFAIILLVICCFQSNEANKLIKDINDENRNDYRKKQFQLAPFWSIIVIIILILLALFLPVTNIIPAE